jgi:prophage regulatory protein
MKKPTEAITQLKKSDRLSTSFEDRMISWTDVKHLTGLSRTGVWRLIQKLDFPPGRQLSPNRVGWTLSEILNWIESRPAVRVRGVDGE